MNIWLSDVAKLTGQNEPCVLITVVATRGSVPRESGTRMVVSTESCLGTIGGGHLEYRAIDIARTQLSDASRPETFAERFPLGASLGQCCGGLVYLLFERLTANGQPWLDFVRVHDARKQPVVMVTQLLPDVQNPRNLSSIRRLVVSETDATGELVGVGVQPSAIAHARCRLFANDGATVETIIASELTMNRQSRSTSGFCSQTLATAPLLFETLQPDAFTIHIFGAGHVGRAIVNVLSGLPCRIHWVDSRCDQFPDTLPANVQTRVSDQPESELQDAPPGSFVLILTHSHALDEIICERALRRDDLAYCGLIGSASKRRSFTRRFEARGLPARSIARLTCPIGMPDLPGKHPGEIAIAVAAELLLVRASGNKSAANSTASTMALVANPPFASSAALESA